VQQINAIFQENRSNWYRSIKFGHFLSKRRWPPKNSTWWTFFQDGRYFCQMLIMSTVQTTV